MLKKASNNTESSASIPKKSQSALFSIYTNHALSALERRGGRTGAVAEIAKRLTSAVRKFKRADTRLQQKKALKEIEDIEKHAGGPGSGTSENNTQSIGMPVSEYVTVGTRQGLVKNAPFFNHIVPLKHIKKVAQEKYVPSKVKSMIKGKGNILQKNIDVLQISPEEYHIIDGHHRYLAAQALGIKELPARVFLRRTEKSVD